MADVTSIYGNPIKDAVARADIATNTQDISDLKDGLQAVEDDVADVKDDLEVFTGNESYNDWLSGFIRCSNATIDITTRETNQNYKSIVIDCSEGDIFTVSGASYGGAARIWAFCASDGTNLGAEEANVTVNNKVITAPANAAYLVSNWYFGIDRPNNIVIVAKNKLLVETVKELSESTTESVNSIIEHTNGVFNYAMSWEIGSIYASGGSNYNISSAVRTPTNSKIPINYNAKVICYNSNILSLYAFKYNTDGTFVERLGTGGNEPIDIDGGFLYRFALIADESAVITSETMSEYTSDTYLTGEEIGEIIIGLNDIKNSSLGNDYAISSDFNKSKITLSAALGTLTHGQSFCIYNNKIYSTSGSGLVAEQNMDFSLVQDVSIWTGHGNSFQLGHNGMAYASGWDDQKVYAVDLNTLTLSEEITLPTTGYTTCAVDDINKLIYIFQRDSYPDTEENYNFITYDYDNSQIVSTKKITVKMAAMQACDFIDGKIFVLNGSGTSAAPNGYRIFNTNGDLISEYVIGSKSSVEPEGIFVDRNTKEIYMSFIDIKMYKLSFS